MCVSPWWLIIIYIYLYIHAFVPPYPYIYINIYIYRDMFFFASLQHNISLRSSSLYPTFPPWLLISHHFALATESPATDQEGYTRTSDCSGAHQRRNGRSEGQGTTQATRSRCGQPGGTSTWNDFIMLSFMADMSIRLELNIYIYTYTYIYIYIYIYMYV